MAEVVGRAKLVPLDSVQPNEWNPNRMSDAMYASLRHGLENDGWLASQALLVWGTDEKGARKDRIIDGEFRWRVATELGMKRGPMVVLDGLEEARAKALTVKMNQKRGEFDRDELGALLRGVEKDLAQLGVTDLALDMGMDPETLFGLLGEPVGEALVGAEEIEYESRDESGPVGTVEGTSQHVRLVQLYFDAVQHEEFTKLVAELGGRYGKDSITEVVLEAVRSAYST